MSKKMQAILKEAGTPERLAQAIRLGDIPEDAVSADTIGEKVRRFTITDQLSWYFRHRTIDQRAYDAGIRWRTDWFDAMGFPKITSRMDGMPLARSNYAHIRVRARQEFARVQKELSSEEFKVCFDVAVWDGTAKGRIHHLRSGLWCIADGYGLARE